MLKIQSGQEWNSTTNKSAISSFKQVNRCIRFLLIQEKFSSGIIEINEAGIWLCYNAVYAQIVDTYSAHFLIKFKRHYQ